MEKYQGEGFGYVNNRHTVEVYLQCNDYKGTVVVQLDGNCYGTDILGAVLDMMETSDFKPFVIEDDERGMGLNVVHTVPDEEGFAKQYVLYRDGDKDSLLVDAEDIGQCVIGAVIIDCRQLQEELL